MDPVLIVIIVVAVVLVLALVVGGFVAARRRRERRELQERFGPEYERAVGEHGEREAKRRLRGREERREQLDIRPLDPTESERYAESWRQTQAKFVDRPSEAIGQADTLVAEVMRKRGYPMDNFEQRAADVSVDHPGVVENYRAAHHISRTHEQGQASTEDLRQAMVHYRSLFEELLDGRSASTAGSHAAGGAGGGREAKPAEGDAAPPGGREATPGEEGAAAPKERDRPPAEDRRPARGEETR